MGAHTMLGDAPADPRRRAAQDRSIRERLAQQRMAAYASQLRALLDRLRAASTIAR